MVGDMLLAFVFLSVFLSVFLWFVRGLFVCGLFVCGLFVVFVRVLCRSDLAHDVRFDLPDVTVFDLCV